MDTDMAAYVAPENEMDPAVVVSLALDEIASRHGGGCPTTSAAP